LLNQVLAKHKCCRAEAEISLKHRQNWDCCCGCELELYEKKGHCEVSFCTSIARSMHVSFDIPGQPTLM